MSRYTVTHIDAARVRRRVVIRAMNRAHAQHMAERQFGLAWFLSALRTA